MHFIAVWHSEPPQQLWMLCGRSIVGGRRHIVTSILANRGCRWVDCGLPEFRCGWIIHNARSKIVDGQLTLISGHGNDHVRSIFA